MLYSQQCTKIWTFQETQQIVAHCAIGSHVLVATVRYRSMLELLLTILVRKTVTAASLMDRHTWPSIKQLSGLKCRKKTQGLIFAEWQDDLSYTLAVLVQKSGISAEKKNCLLSKRRVRWQAYVSAVLRAVILCNLDLRMWPSHINVQPNEL